MDRVKLIQVIHVAKRELRLNEETYRTALRTASRGRVDSTSSMTDAELKATLESFKRAGFRVRTSGTPAAAPRPLDQSDFGRKVRALWLFLFELGAVRDPSETALAAYVKRITGVDDLRWVPGRKADMLIESLKKWAMRYLPAEVTRLRREVMERHQVTPLTPEQSQHAMQAQRCLLRGDGYDLTWWAYEELLQALGRRLGEKLAAARPARREAAHG